MKRLINYIKDLFGADEKLRKWAVEENATRLCPEPLKRLFPRLGRCMNLSERSGNLTY